MKNKDQVSEDEAVVAERTERTRIPKKYRSEAMAAIYETAADLHLSGGIDRMTMRKFDALCLTPERPFTLPH